MSSTPPVDYDEEKKPCPWFPFLIKKGQGNARYFLFTEGMVQMMPSGSVSYSACKIDGKDWLISSRYYDWRRKFEYCFIQPSKAPLQSPYDADLEIRGKINSLLDSLDEADRESARMPTPADPPTLDPQGDPVFVPPPNPNPLKRQASRIGDYTLSGTTLTVNKNNKP